MVLFFFPFKLRHHLNVVGLVIVKEGKVKHLLLSSAPIVVRKSVQLGLVGTESFDLLKRKGAEQDASFCNCFKFKQI